ncbi:MAG: sulfatase-like hydrolase/transferase, partial [Acidimicrobiales bacterium]
MGVIPPGTELAPLNPGVRPWSELADDERRLACRFQEAFAAMLEHTDAQLGRLLDTLDELAVTDDTIIVALSDNGASQEGLEHGLMDTFLYFNGLSQAVEDGLDRLDDIGTRRSNTNYPWGWAQVGNSPGKRYKQNTHGGGVRDPLIISWPNGIDPEVTGQTRQQFHHVSDIVPSLYEVLGIDAPDTVKGVAQQPIEGTSLAYTFTAGAEDPAAVPTHKTSQYFEMQGHRAICADGWKAVSFHRPGDHLDDDQWELYHGDEDFSEGNDLARSEPERLERLIELFWVEAGRYGVLPIQPSSPQLFSGHRTPGTPRDRERFVYYPPLPRVPPDAAPSLGSRCWQLRAEVERGAADAGALLSFGTANNGLMLYIDAAGHLIYDHNAFTEHTVIRSDRPVPVGRSVLELHQDRVKRGPGRARLMIDGHQVAAGHIEMVPLMISAIGLDVGSNPSGVSDAYRAPFPFAGTISRLEINTQRAFDPHEEAAMELLAAERMQ